MASSAFDGLSWCFENGVGQGAEREYVGLRGGSKRGVRKADSRRRRRSRDGDQAKARSASGSRHGATETARGLRRRASLPVRRNLAGSSDSVRWWSKSFQQRGINTPEMSVSSLGRGDSVEGTDICRSLDVADFVGDEDSQALTDEADTLGTGDKISAQDMAGEVDVPEEMEDEPHVHQEMIEKHNASSDMEYAKNALQGKAYGVADETDVHQEGIENHNASSDMEYAEDVLRGEADEPDVHQEGIENHNASSDMEYAEDALRGEADGEADELDVHQEGIENHNASSDMEYAEDALQGEADEPDVHQEGIENHNASSDMEYAEDALQGEADGEADEPDVHQEGIENHNASSDVEYVENSLQMEYAEGVLQGKADGVADKANGVREDEMQSDEGGVDFSALLASGEVMDAVGSDGDEAAGEVTADDVQMATSVRQPSFGRIGRGVRRLVYLALGVAPVVLWSSGIGRGWPSVSMDMWTRKTVAMTRVLHIAVGRDGYAAAKPWSQKIVNRVRLLYAVVGMGCDAVQGVPVMEPTSPSSSSSSSASASSLDAGHLAGDVALGLEPGARFTASLPKPTIGVVAEDSCEKVAIPGELKLESEEAGKLGTLRTDVDRSASGAGNVDAKDLSSYYVLDWLMGRRSLCIVDFPKNHSRDDALGRTGMDTRRAKKARVNGSQAIEADSATGLGGLTGKDKGESHGVPQVPGVVQGSSEARLNSGPYDVESGLHEALAFDAVAEPSNGGLPDADALGEGAEDVNGGIPEVDAFLHVVQPNCSGREEVDVVSDADRRTDTNFPGPWFNIPDGEMRTVQFIRQWDEIRKGRTSESHCTSETLMLGPMKGRKGVMVFQEPGQSGKIVWASMRNPLTRAKKAVASWIRSTVASVAGVRRRSGSSPPVGCSGVYLSRMDGNLALVIGDGGASKESSSPDSDRVVVIHDVGSSSPEEEDIAFQGERDAYVAMMAPRGHVCVLSDSGWVYWMSKGVNTWRMSMVHGV